MAGPAPDTEVRVVAMEGNCPVEAWGYCCGGRPFYFRARGRSIRIDVGLAPEALGEGERLAGWIMRTPTEAVWSHREGLGAWPEAGWMAQRDALAFIRWAAVRFVYAGWGGTIGAARLSKEEAAGLA